MPEPLCPALDKAILAIAGRLFPDGFDTSDAAPETLADITEHYRRTGRILVSGAYSADTIYGSPEVNFAMRAWHDLRHIEGQYGFDRQGERATFETQRADLYAYFYPNGGRKRLDDEYALARLYLVADIVGQSEYYAVYGRFPAQQRAFVLAYVRNPRDALANETF